MEQASSYHIHIGLHAATVLAMANDHIVDVTLCYTSNRSYTRDVAGEVEDRPGHVQTCESQEGFLHAGNIGLSVLKNPSERRSGVSRFIRLSKEIDVWRNCAEHLAAHFDTTFKIVLRPVFKILSDAKLRTYDHKPIYKNIRVIRALVTSTGNTFADTPDCWSIWRQMSKHIRVVVLASGLWDFKDAVRFRDAMAKTLNEAYTFADLMCFMCLQNSDCFDHNPQKVICSERSDFQ